MDKVKKIAAVVLRIIGRVLLVDLGVLGLVSLSCLIGTRCTGIAWGERLFWVGLFMLLAASGIAVAVFGSGKRPNYKELDQGANYEPFETVEEETKYARWGSFAWQVGLMGLGIILLSVLIDTLARR